MEPEGLPVQAKRLNRTGSPRGLGVPHHSWKSGCEGRLARSSSARWGGGEGSAVRGEGSQREDGEPRSPAPSPKPPLLRRLAREGPPLVCGVWEALILLPESAGRGVLCSESGLSPSLRPQAPPPASRVLLVLLLGPCICTACSSSPVLPIL